MGARGPQPTPTATLKARGSWLAKRRAADGEPQVPCLEKLPPAPKRLSAQAKKLWKTLGQRLLESSLLTNLDLDVLADLCVVQARLEAAEENLVKFGEVLVGDGGGMYQSPYLSIANRCMQQLQALRAQFGMGPASRTRVRAAPTPEAPEPQGKARFFAG